MSYLEDNILQSYSPVGRNAKGEWVNQPGSKPSPLPKDMSKPHKLVPITVDRLGEVVSQLQKDGHGSAIVGLITPGGEAWNLTDDVSYPPYEVCFVVIKKE
jgi:hypothetical protein